MLPVDDYPWYFKASLLANFYLGLGMIARMHQTKVIQPLLEKKSVLAVLLLAFAVMLIADIAFVHNVGSFNHDFTCYPFFIMETMVSVPLLISLSNLWKKHNRLILFVGQSSLLYYFFQRQAYVAIDKVLHQLGIAEPSLLWAFVEMIGTVVVLIIPIMIVNRWLPFMSGKLRFKLRTK